MKRLNLNLPDAVYESIKAESEREDRTLTAVVMRALRYYNEGHGQALLPNMPEWNTQGGIVKDDKLPDANRRHPSMRKWE